MIDGNKMREEFEAAMSTRGITDPAQTQGLCYSAELVHAYDIMCDATDNAAALHCLAEAINAILAVVGGALKLDPKTFTENIDFARHTVESITARHCPQGIVTEPTTLQ